MYRLLCTECSVQIAMYRMLCTECDVQNAKYRLQCTECDVQNAMYRLQCTEAGVQTLTMCILNLVTLTYSFLVTRAMIPKTGKKRTKYFKIFMTIHVL